MAILRPSGPKLGHFLATTNLDMKILNLILKHFFLIFRKIKKPILDNCLKFLNMKFVDFFNNPDEARSVHKFKIQKNDGFFKFSWPN